MRPIEEKWYRQWRVMTRSSWWLRHLGYDDWALLLEGPPHGKRVARRKAMRWLGW